MVALAVGEMNAAWSAIVVAVIGGPLMWLLYRLDRRNTQQHGESIKIIQEVQRDVKDVKGDIHDVKADVRDLKSDVRRLDKTVKPTRIKKTA
jgi:hypothetical protein